MPDLAGRASASTRSERSGRAAASQRPCRGGRACVRSDPVTGDPRSRRSVPSSPASTCSPRRRLGRGRVRRRTPSAPSGPSSSAAGSASTAGSARRPGGRWTPPAGGSAPARSTTRCPSRSPARTSGRCRSGCWRWGTTSGRADAIYGVRTARAVAQFQREVGLTPDGACGPHTMNALRRLGRKVVGGRPQWLRESDAFRQSGPTLVGKTIVIDPGHGGTDPGVVVPDGPLRWTEADLVLRPGQPAGGPARRGRDAGAPDPRARRPAAACPTSTGPQLANDARRRPAHLAAHRRARQPGGGRGGHLPLRHRQRRHLDDRGAAGRAGAAGDRRAHRAARLPVPTPRPGTCCG